MYHLPSTWRRLVARLLDDGYVFILQLPVIIIFVTNVFRTNEFKIHWAHAVYFVLVRILYESLSLAFFSTTLGKRQLGLQVINQNKMADKSKISLEQAILRSLVSQLSHIFGWSLFVTALYKYNRTHIADWVADTQVVSFIPRTKRPQVRWVFATGFIFLFLTGSIKGAVVAVQSLTWNKPYIHIQNSDMNKLFQSINIQFDSEDSEEFVEE